MLRATYLENRPLTYRFLDAQPEASLPPCPTNPEWADWDHPPTALNYPLFLRSLQYSKKEGKVDERVGSHDHLNEREGGLSIHDGGDEGQDGGQDLVRRWRERFEGLKRESEGRRQDTQVAGPGSTSVEGTGITDTTKETPIVEGEEGVRVVFGLVDGFLLYWDEVRLFTFLTFLALAFWMFLFCARSGFVLW